MFILEYDDYTSFHVSAQGTGPIVAWANLDSDEIMWADDFLEDPHPSHWIPLYEVQL